MKRFSVFFLLLLSGTLFGQKIEKFYTYNWKECEPGEARFYSITLKTDSGYLRKDYFLHENSLQMAGKYSDAESKNADGYFYYFYPNGAIAGLGRYENGKKEGVWLQYSPEGMLIDSGFYSKGNSIGTYVSWHANGFMKDSSETDASGNGVHITWFDNSSIASAGYMANFTKRYGTWKFYHRNGELSSKETYQNGQLMNKSYFNESGELLSDTTNTDRDATFPGGMKAWLKYLEKHIYFPSQFKIVNADKAVVVVSFTVNELGKVEEVYVSTPFYPAFDKIAKDVIAKAPDWQPAMNHNRKVKFTMRQIVTFDQSGE